MSDHDGRSGREPQGFKPQSQSESSSEINLLQLVQLLARNKLLVVLVFVVASTMAYFKTAITKSYSAQLSLMIQKAENSPLQAITSEFGGAARSNFSFGAKDSMSEKYMVYLQSRDFVSEVAPMIFPYLQPGELRPLFESESLRYAKGTRAILRRFLSGNSVIMVRLEKYIGEQPTPVLDQGGLAKTLSYTSSFSRVGVSGIGVAVRTPDAALSVKLSNLVGKAAMEVLNKRETKELDEAIRYLKSKIREERAELETIKNRMLSLRQKFVSRGGGGSEEAAKRIDRFLTDVESARLKIDENHRMIQVLSEGVVRATEKKSTTGSTGALEYSETLRRQLDALVERRARMLAEGLATKSKKVKELDEEIRRTSDKIKVILNSNIRTRTSVGGEIFANDLDLKSKMDNLERENVILEAKILSGAKMLEKLRKGQRGVPEFEQTYMDLVKAMDIQYQQYLQLTRQQFQVEMQRISVQNRISIVEFASGDEINISPNLQSNMISNILMALLSLLGLLLLWEKTHPIVRRTRDLQDLGVQTIALIPDLKKRLILGNRKGTFIHKYMINHYLDTPQSIAFKHLRTKILQLQPVSSRGSVKVISIHSSLPHEGKTFISMNVACSLAAAGKRVVLVDGDIRVHALTDVFVRHSTVGLSTILAHNDPLDYVLMTNTSVNNLDFVPAGKFFEHATELLASPSFSAMLQQLRDRYDFVIIDTPPTLPIPDSAIIGAQTDLVLLSVMAHETRILEVSMALDRLSSAAKGLIMTVLNKGEQLSRNHYYYKKRNNFSWNRTENVVAMGSPQATAESSPSSARTPAVLPSPTMATQSPPTVLTALALENSPRLAPVKKLPDDDEGSSAA